MDKVFFCNSGTEANEAAFKFARKVARTRFPDVAGKTEVVVFEGSFHGRTMGALSLTSNNKYKDPFEPLIPGVTFAPLNCQATAKGKAMVYNGVEGSAINERTAAVFVEPVQGEGGVHPAKQEFLRNLRETCDRVGALLIFDEVQCGLGRTGALFAHEHFGVVPDVLTLAKPLAGGLPIGAVMVKDFVADCMGPGDHGTTFGGNPLCCAVADAT